MALREILRESFEMLMDKPKMFIPRFISTSISTLWVLSFPGIYSGNLSAVNMESMIYYLSSMPLIVLLGVFVSVMLAEMVADKPFLKKSFLKTLDRWKTILGVTVGILASTILFYITVSIGFFLSLSTGSLIFTGLGALVSLVLALGFSFAIFFLPISITENERLLKSFKASMGASKRNSKEVALLMIFGIGLLGVAFSMQGTLQSVGVAGFVVSRFISAVMTTYLFVVSPKMYMTQSSVE